MKNKKIEIIVISIVLIIQTLIYVFVGAKKSYIHMDEAYSLGLASFDKVEIQDNENFYNTWHSKDYYEDYISVQESEKGKYAQVYENQKNDVHPPLYYLFLRIAMGFSKNGYSKWPGIAVNIIIFIGITLLTYLILQELLENEKYAKEKSAILALISAITMASLTNVIYIRMYALSTFNIMLTTFFHIKLLKCGKVNPKLLFFIGLSALFGSLTHYYYLFFLAMMYLIFAIKFAKEKNWKNLEFYTLTMAVAAIISLAIFPYSINHMFFGYRGQGVIDKFKDISMFLENIKEYLKKVNRFCFNGIGLYILLFEICAYIYLKMRKIILKSTKKDLLEDDRHLDEYEKHQNKKNSLENRKKYASIEKFGIVQNKEIFSKCKIILAPTLFYFLLVAVASPWIELRYIMPICSLIFAMGIYFVYILLKNIFSEKATNIVMTIILIAIIISPAIFKIEPEVMFSDKKEIVSILENELNLPTLYVFYSENNRFLDDILLFAKLDNSYIAKDLECSSENINQIFEGKDTSKRIIVFINKDEGNEKVLEPLCNTLNFKNIKYLKRMNACNIYFID